MLRFYFFLSCLFFLCLFNKSYTQTSGTLKWEFETGDGVISSPAISEDGTIYVGSHDDKLYAINPDGSKKWEFEAGGNVFSSPAIGEGGTIYVGSDDNKLYAINPDGSKKWEFESGDDVSSSPAISADGTIYVGSDDNRLYAINPGGSKKWEFETSGDVNSSPIIGEDGTIYVGSDDNKLYAINLDGSEKWEFQTSGDVESSAAIVADGTIYVGSDDKKLYAINPDGSKKWEFETGGNVDSSPAIGKDGTIYVGSWDDKLYAINPDGSKKWEFETSYDIEASPTIGADGTIYLGSWDDKLYAINPDGSKKWEFETGDNVDSSPVISADGTIYVGSNDHKLYALHSESNGLADSPWPKFRKDTRNTGSNESMLVNTQEFEAFFFEDSVDAEFPLKFYKNSNEIIAIQEFVLLSGEFECNQEFPINLQPEDSSLVLTIRFPEAYSCLKTLSYVVDYSEQDKNYTYSGDIEIAVILSDSTELSLIGKQAIEAYHACKDSNQIAAENNKGVIYRLLGATAKAETYFNSSMSNALEQFHGYSGIKMNQGVVISDIGKSDSALNHYEDIIEDFPEEETDSSTLIPRIHYNMAWENHQLGQYSESRQKAMETIEHEKSNDFLKAKAYILLGVNEAALGDTVEALGCFEDAISLNPGFCIENIALVNISLLLNPESYEFITICQGESYNGWITSGIYARTAQSSTGEDSIVATFLQVNPSYDVFIDTLIDEGESYNGWTEPGYYQQTFQTVTGCDSIVTIHLEVQYGVDVQQHTGNNKFRIYPNPNTGSFRLLFNETITDAITIEIYSITGRKVFEEKVSYVMNDHLIRLSGVPKGLYIILVQNGETTMVEKIVLE